MTLVGYCPFNALLHGTNLTAGWEARLGRSIDLAFDGLDGCHVSPYGPLILTEDGDTANHVLSWSRDAGFQAIARNQVVLRINAARRERLQRDDRTGVLPKRERALQQHLQPGARPGHHRALEPLPPLSSAADCGKGAVGTPYDGPPFPQFRAQGPSRTERRALTFHWVSAYSASHSDRTVMPPPVPSV